MTPTRKGLYIECKKCIFRLEEEKKYPCLKSHKEIREAFLNTDNKKCSLFIENQRNIKHNEYYWTYIFGNLELVQVINIFNIKKDLLVTIKTSNGNLRNLSINKIYKEKKDLINYLERRNIALNLILKYDLDTVFGIEEERY